VSEHTPGPWKVLLPAKDDDYTKPLSIAEANHPDSPDKFRIADVYAWGSSKERNATARLIAAAPDLLEACKAIVTSCRVGIGGGVYNETQSALEGAYFAAVAAIAKTKSPLPEEDD